MTGQAQHPNAETLAAIGQPLWLPQAMTSPLIAPDGEPDRAAGCAVGGGQLWLGWQLVPWPQRAGVDLFPQVVGDLPVLGASHRFSVLRAYI